MHFRSYLISIKLFFSLESQTQVQQNDQTLYRGPPDSPRKAHTRFFFCLDYGIFAYLVCVKRYAGHNRFPFVSANIVAVNWII